MKRASKFGRAGGRGRAAIVVAAGALVGAGALAGCGGSSDTSTSATNAAVTGSGGSSTTPNPSTSGSARWNIMAAYGAELKEGKTPAQALAYVKTLLTKNVSVQDASGATARQTFTSGKGDVLISYESEAISAVKAGDAVQ